MRVLVTGASGFIGGHVARYLAREHEVVGLVRSCTLSEGADRTGVSCIRDDLLRMRILPRVDVIVHAAATSPQSGVDHLTVMRDGVFATARLIELANCDRIIFCSSLSLHGSVAGPTVQEDTPSIDPDVYGASKLICERALVESKIPTVALRLPGVLGRGAHRIWLARVAEKLMADETVTVYHPRSWFNNAAYVTNLAHFISHLVERPWTGFHAMPLGAGSYMEPLALVAQLRDALGSSSEIEVSSWHLESNFNVNNRLAREWGYDPMPLDEMLALYARDLRETEVVAA